MIVSGAIPTTDPALAAALARGLDRVVGRMSDQLNADLPEVRELCTQVEKYRGKMLRPVLTLLSGAAAAGRPLEDAMDDAHVVIASVVEMIHLATLVHDDVLDDADTRRGVPTIARMRSSEVAVILGDYLLSRAYHLCSTLQSQHSALRVGEITSTVCEGEILQLVRRGRPDLDEQTYMTIIERKTAALTAVSCELGAHHSGADAELSQRFHAFGRDLGVAFQIQDDLLDLVGDERVVGKTLGKDIEMGKVTLPVLHFLRTCATDERAELSTLIRAQVPLNGERASVVDRLHAAGSIAYAQGVAQGLVDRAKGQIVGLPASDARDQLLMMADQVIRRDF